MSYEYTCPDCGELLCNGKPFGIRSAYCKFCLYNENQEGKRGKDAKEDWYNNNVTNKDGDYEDSE